MYPHRIRLRGPWDCEPLSHRGGTTAEKLPGVTKMPIPGRWNEAGLGDFRGLVRLIRGFGSPRRLDAHERVWLTFGGVERTADVSLNGQPLGRHEGDDPFEFDITPLLRERNTLVVEVESDTGAGGIWGDVALEVRCQAFLRGVRVWYVDAGRAVDLHAAGSVVGTSDRPLELSLTINARSVARERVEATLGGRPFHLAAERVAVVRSPSDTLETSRLYKVRVDLVSGTMIWYGFQEVMAFPEEGTANGPSAPDGKTGNS